MPSGKSGRGRPKSSNPSDTTMRVRLYRAASKMKSKSEQTGARTRFSPAGTAVDEEEVDEADFVCCGAQISAPITPREHALERQTCAMMWCLVLVIMVSVFITYGPSVYRWRISWQEKWWIRVKN